MHFIVLGAGRVGRALSKRLTESNHTVAVVSMDEDALKAFPQYPGVKTIRGFGFDPDILTRAGAFNAYAFAAVTDDDNHNILATRMAREKFGIEKVVARIYNFKRAEIFERLGIPTVATIRWTADQVYRQIIPIGATDEYRDPSGKVSLLQIDYDDSWLNHSVGEIESIIPAKVAFLTRTGSAFMPKQDDKLQANDILHLLVTVDNIDDISHLLSKQYSRSKS